MQQNGVSKQVTHVETVGAPTTFNGQSATPISVRETIQSAGMPDVLFQGIHYVALSASSVDLVGTSASFDQAGTTVVQTLALTPKQPDLDFSLTAGDSRAVDSMIDVSYTPAGTAPARFPASMTVTFVGPETVTVPAGTFPGACKFVLDVTTSQRQTTTRWIAAGSGVMLRSVTGSGDTQELLQATIDGTTVAP